MKKNSWLIIIILSLLLAHCQRSQQNATGQQQTEKIVSSEKNQVRATLRVKGMTCTGCETTVETGVKEIAGVIDVTASHIDSTAHVVFDSTQTSLVVIEEGINQSGYQVSKDN